MNTIPLFSYEEIQAQVSKIASQINSHYGQSDILAIGILTGVFSFYTDLLRQLEATVTCDFCSVSFYGNDVKARQEASLILDIHTSVKGKNVLLIDCMSDYGHSLNFIQRHIEERKPKSLKTTALIAKPAALQNSLIDFTGFQVEQDVFVVGYGIDYKNQGRHLNHFAQVSNIN